MKRGEQLRHFEVEGYLILPEILDQETVARLKQELADAEMTHKSYSVYQTTGVKQPQWHSRAACELIGYPPMIEILAELLGKDIVFTRGFFQRTLPGSPPISMHTDGQPHGSDLFGYEGSCPKLIRVLYYLDDLTAQRAPFRVIPRSHLSFHADASPYIRYKHHPKEITLTCPGWLRCFDPSDGVSWNASQCRSQAERADPVWISAGLGRTNSAHGRMGSRTRSGGTRNCQAVSAKLEQDRSPMGAASQAN